MDTGNASHRQAPREFASPEEMADRLRPKGSYGIFDPDILLDYCRYGLVPNETGTGYLLACPPEVEASIYLSSRSNHGIYDLVRTLEVPVVVVRAKEPAKPGKTGENGLCIFANLAGPCGRIQERQGCPLPGQNTFPANADPRRNREADQGGNRIPAQPGACPLRGNPQAEELGPPLSLGGTNPIPQGRVYPKALRLPTLSSGMIRLEITYQSYLALRYQDPPS